jgi:hypothetical protein
MKIVINIDLEAIVRDAIYKYVSENVEIINAVGTGVNVAVDSLQQSEVENEIATNLASSTEAVPKETNSVGQTVRWEYAPKPGKRRSPAEIALHDKELALGRVLTPEEKGETKGLIEVDENAEEKAKQETIKQARIDKIAKDAEDAVAAEDKTPVGTASVTPEEKTALTASGTNAKPLFAPSTTGNAEQETPVIPKADNLDKISQLFKN